jgi:hypothetical protein
LTLVFLTKNIHYLQYITTSLADSIASAQSLRITRKLWKAARSNRDSLNDAVLPREEGENEKWGEAARCEPEVNGQDRRESVVRIGKMGLSVL